MTAIGVRDDFVRNLARRNILVDVARKRADPASVALVMTMMTQMTSRLRDGNQGIPGAEGLNRNLGVSAPEMNMMILNRSAALLAADGRVLRHREMNCLKPNPLRSRLSILNQPIEGRSSSDLR
mmetsp:Transcript_33227/g.61745  ORF Transcript_33227/g.61745 Transcript_33227/m.61745 type:complete len:124 (-) Transcript_33227:814-1185(-)